MDVLSLLFLKPFQQEAGSLGEHFGIYSLAFSAKQEIAWGEDTKEIETACRSELPKEGVTDAPIPILCKFSSS